MNGATFALGLVGQAFSFDGFDDRVDVQDTGNLSPPAITLDAWVNPDSDSVLLDGLVVRVRGRSGPLCSFEHVNADSFLDLVCHFEDDPENWTTGEDSATLSGNLFDGTPIEGTDSICVVP